MAKAIGPRKIQHIVDAHSTLKHFAQTASDAENNHQSSTKPLRLTLPPALKEHTQAFQDEHVLVLVAANNAVAQILRFHAPRLAKQAGLNEWYVKVARINVGQQDNQHQLPQATLCAASAKVLRDTAATIQHPGLQAALLRLASNAPWAQAARPLWQAIFKWHKKTQVC